MIKTKASQKSKPFHFFVWNSLNHWHGFFTRLLWCLHRPCFHMSRFVLKYWSKSSEPHWTGGASTSTLVSACENMPWIPVIPVMFPVKIFRALGWFASFSWSSINLAFHRSAAALAACNLANPQKMSETKRWTRQKHQSDKNTFKKRPKVCCIELNHKATPPAVWSTARSLL